MEMKCKLQLEIIPDIDVSPIGKIDGCKEEYLTFMDHFTAQFIRDEDAVKKLFISQIITDLNCLNLKVENIEPLMSIYDIYNKEDDGAMFLKVADTCEIDTRNFIYQLFSPMWEFLMGDGERAKYRNILYKRLSSIKLSLGSL